MVTQKYCVQGIKIQLKGRLNGLELAKIDWKKQGSIPLQSIDIKIDYISDKVKTSSGTIGIKIWLHI